MENSLGRTLYRFYLKLRKWLAFVLLLVVLGLRFVPNSDIQFGVFIALGLLILQVLFEVHDRTTTLEKPRVFSEFFDAVPHMQKKLTISLQEKSDVSIRWLGMTMQHAWPFLANTLQPFLLGTQRVQVQCELAMLDATWPGLEMLNPSWPGRAQANNQTIETYKETHDKQIRSKNWSITVHRYRHMPNWHGLLIDNRYLFLSACYWKAGVLYGAENQYEFFEAGDAFGGEERIIQFNSWFEYCATQSRSTAT